MLLNPLLKISSLDSRDELSAETETQEKEDFVLEHSMDSIWNQG